MAEFLSLFATADLLGRYRYVELLGFSLLGERAPRCPTARAALFFSGASHAHAWRARLFEELLPVSVGLPSITELTRSPDARVDEAIACALGEQQDEDALALVASCLYPAMADGYRRHRDRASRISDGAVLLALDRAIADLDVQCEAAANLSASLDSKPDASKARVSRYRADLADRLGKLLVSTDGPFGPLQGADESGVC